MTDWRTAVLKAVGAPPTQQNLRFLQTWQRWEGGDTHNDAKFNWLNTTTGEGQKINSVGVKRFRSFGEGVMNTARTLMNGRYGDILEGLAKGDPYSHDVSAGLQTWVSGRPDGNPAYAAKVLGRQAAQTPPIKQRATAAAQRVKGQMAVARSSPNVAWDEAMKLIFDDDPEMAEILAQSDDRIAQESGIVAPGGSLKGVDLDTPEFEEAPGAGLKLAKLASTQLGKPYVFGSGPSTESFDCSDLIQWAYKQIGIDIPRVTYDQIKIGRSVKGQKLQPGDLVFPNSGHVVMYIGDGKVIAAPYTGTVVQVQPLSRWKSLLDVRRVL